VIGVVGSAALVVPGISGSMLLLILGYYNPIIALITEHFLKGEDMLTALGVLGVLGVGIVVGFFLISVIMKLLLERCPRGTYFAILGFIVGSVPTVFISTAKDVGMTLSTLPTSVWHWIACAALLALGFVGAFLFVKEAKKLNKNAE
jgi:putative membrane protein